MDMATAMATAKRQKCPSMQFEMRSFADESARVLRLSVMASLAALPTTALGESRWVETSVSVSETFTDNVDVGNKGRSDWITEISPSLSVHRTNGHATGRFDASFRNILYANEGSRNASFFTLNGKGSLELIDDSLFIDIKSTVGRNNLSSFRGRSQWDSQSTQRESEIRYLSISPRWVGNIGQSDTQFSASYDGETLAYGSDMTNQSNGTLRVRLFDPTAGELFGWSLDYRKSGNSYHDQGQKNVTDTSLSGTLTFHATRQFALRAIAGTEKNNYIAGRDDSGMTLGYGFNWRPTPRTTVDGLFENHVYGDTFDIRFSHRRPLSAWDLRLTREISSAYQSATNSLGSYYYNLFSSSLISQFPDPIQRDQAVRELMKELGISTGGAFGNFASNAFFIERRIQAGASLIGARHTLAFTAYHSDKEKTDSNLATSPSDDFANNDNIQNSGATVSLSHKLTASSDLNGAVFWSRSEGTGGGAAQSRRNKGLVLSYSRKLGVKTSGAVNLRRETSSGNDQFTENSVTASLSHSF
jgi:uncharacterized protein (PEP-CTERM system associated)